MRASTARKRTAQQKHEDLAIAVELRNAGKKLREIAEVISSLRPYSISLWQVGFDLRRATSAFNAAHQTTYLFKGIADLPNQLAATVRNSIDINNPNRP